MSNREHLEILKQGVEVWNNWRMGNLDIVPDLSSSFLNNFKLSKVNLNNADLSFTELIKADLSFAKLNNAGLSFTNLHKADISDASLIKADISRSLISYAKLIRAKFDFADLRNSSFYYTDLSYAGLNYADLSHASLGKANLSYATLHDTTFNNTKLEDTKFKNAIVGGTIFSSTDLRGAIELETVKHVAPSEIGISTIYLSEGKIPEIFLRGCGVPDEFITYMRSLVAHPIQFYSCFISYSSKNQLFADRLYADLQNKGVRCWLASEDLKIGDRIRVGIDESIRFHDKLLLVLSKHSVASDWVEQEVETALGRERREKRTVLFPIRLDDTVMKIDTGWPALIKNTRNIGDFRKWKNPEAYQKAFDRLLRDLKAEEKKS